MSRKGQVVQLIAVVFLFFIVVVLALYQFTALVTGGGIAKQTINQRFNHEVGDIRRMTALQTALSDRVYRSPQVPRGRYSATAYELTSLYFSTPDGQRIRINGERFSKSRVREDLRNYFSFKMNRTWFGNYANPVDYHLTAGRGRNDSFSVSVDKRYPGAQWNLVSLPVALASGNKTRLMLWTRTENRIFEVEPF
ncbi:MAG: hypothetical protein ABEJ98_05890 [Candidatus Nanohaloarchaea archaeon]